MDGEELSSLAATSELQLSTALLSVRRRPIFSPHHWSQHTPCNIRSIWNIYTVLGIRSIWNFYTFLLFAAATGPSVSALAPRRYLIHARTSLRETHKTWS